MVDLPIKELKEIFDKYDNIKVAYIFGSRARGESKTTSDYDFAIYLEGTSSKQNWKVEDDLTNDLSYFLKTDNIDVVVLNQIDNPVLKFLIIKEGIVLKATESYKAMIEPKILNEYFDFILTFRKETVNK